MKVPSLTKKSAIKIKEKINGINLKKLNDSQEDYKSSTCQKVSSLFEKVLGDKTRITAKTRAKTNSIAGSFVSKKTSISKGSMVLGNNEVFTEPSLREKKVLNASITPRTTKKIDIFTKTPRENTNTDYKYED